MASSLVGVVFALLAASCYALNNTLAKVSVGRSKNPIALSVLYQTLAGIFSLIFIFEDGMRFTQVSWLSLILLIAATVAYGVGTTYNFKAVRLIDVSLSSIIGQMSLVLAFFGSILIFSESVTWGKFFGVFMIIGGNLLVLGFQTKAKVNFKAVGFKLLSCFLFALANIMDGYNSKYFPLSFYLFTTFFFAGVLTMAFFKTRFAELIVEFKINKWRQLLMALFSAFGFYLFLRAFVYTEKSVVIPLFYLNSILVVFIGIIVLKERKMMWRKLIAIFISFIGGLLISM